MRRVASGRLKIPLHVGMLNQCIQAAAKWAGNLRSNKVARSVEYRKRVLQRIGGAESSGSAERNFWLRLCMAARTLGAVRGE